MRTAVIVRNSSTDDGTFGQFTLDDGWKCYSGELPDRENMPSLSRIPSGAYLCRWALSPNHGWCYHVTNVPGRSEIEIHAGNWCGDRQLGKKCDLLGCIALGLGFGELDGQAALLQSKAAIEEFHKQMDREDLQLIIHDAPQPICDPEDSV